MKTKKELADLYNSHHDNCCKCGVDLLSCPEHPLGDFFVMDNDGNFYCMACDAIFEDVDERIYVPEEE